MKILKYIIEKVLCDTMRIKLKNVFYIIRIYYILVILVFSIYVFLYLKYFLKKTMLKRKIATSIIQNDLHTTSIIK